MEQTSIKIGLKYPPEKTDQPVVTNLVEYGLKFNILKAYVTPGKKGTILLELFGKDEDIAQGLSYLQDQGIIVRTYTDSVIRFEEKCIHCGACTAVCPSGALKMNQDTWELEFDMNECMLCGHCVRACPARAIKSFEDALF